MELERIAILRAVAETGGKSSEIAKALGITAKERPRLRRMLSSLVEAGELERAGARYVTRRREEEDALAPGLSPPLGAEEARTGAVEARSGAELAQAAHPARVTGTIRVHPAGYGFVERNDGEADVFVPARFRGDALDGDRVQLVTWMGAKGVEGRVTQVVVRGRAKLTGVLVRQGRQVLLEPDDPRIAKSYGRVGIELLGEAREGDCVVAEITHYPGDPHLPRGFKGAVIWARVTHVLGDPDDPRTEVAKIISCDDIPEQFPDDALHAALHTPIELGPGDFVDRVDMRDREFLTIDPETARDFDDAVCVEERSGGFRIWVAVADVSHYVSPGNPIDREARERGCSVYLPDRAIPMLPPELSSGICSLNPEVDRLAMVVRIDTDHAGVPSDTAFCAAVIRSHARLDYPGVAAALKGDLRGLRARYRPFLTALQRMNVLAQRMRERRRERGSLDFDLPEAFVVLDDDDPALVRDVRRSKSSPEVKIAYQLIEEFMVAANEAVAAYFARRGLDCIWRVHDVPDDERLETFAQLAESYGIKVSRADGLTPLALQKVLSAISGRPCERALNFLLLRSLKQAVYDVVNVGHFGLASRGYLHFTSPIRRYPDLIVHRLLKLHLRKDGQAAGGPSMASMPSRETLAEMATESSSHERRAVEAEREVVDMYRAFLMRERIGEELDGIVSGVTDFGLFVECSEPYVEGLIRRETLGFRCEFDPTAYKLIVPRNGRTFTLGSEVRVRVVDVSVARRRIDLELVDANADVPVRTREKARRAGMRGRPGQSRKQRRNRR